MSLSSWIMVEISSTSRKWKLLAERQRHPSILPLMVYSCHLVILLLCLFVILLVWQLVSFSAFLLCNCCYHLNNSRQHHRQLQPVERTQHQQQVRLLLRWNLMNLVHTNMNIKPLESNFCTANWEEVNYLRQKTINKGIWIQNIHEPENV